MSWLRVAKRNCINTLGGILSELRSLLTLFLSRHCSTSNTMHWLIISTTVSLDLYDSLRLTGLKGFQTAYTRIHWYQDEGQRTWGARVRTGSQVFTMGWPSVDCWQIKGQLLSSDWHHDAVPCRVSQGPQEESEGSGGLTPEGQRYALGLNNIVGLSGRGQQSSHSKSGALERRHG